MLVSRLTFPCTSIFTKRLLHTPHQLWVTNKLVLQSYVYLIHFKIPTYNVTYETYHSREALFSDNFYKKLPHFHIFFHTHTENCLQKWRLAWFLTSFERVCKWWCAHIAQSSQINLPCNCHCCFTCSAFDET